MWSDVREKRLARRTMGSSSSKHGTFISVFDSIHSTRTVSKVSKRLDAIENDIEWARAIAEAWRGAAELSKSDSIDPQVPVRLRVFKHKNTKSELTFEKFLKKPVRDVDVRAVAPDAPFSSNEILYIPSVAVQIQNGGSTTFIRPTGPFGISMPYNKEQEGKCWASRLMLHQLMVLLSERVTIPEDMKVSFAVKMCTHDLCLKDSPMATCSVPQLLARMRFACMTPEGQFRLVVVAADRAPKADRAAAAADDAARAEASANIRVDASSLGVGTPFIKLPLRRCVDVFAVEQALRDEVRKIIPATTGDVRLYIQDMRVDAVAAYLLACNWVGAQAVETLISRLTTNVVRVEGM